MPDTLDDIIAADLRRKSTATSSPSLSSGNSIADKVRFYATKHGLEDDTDHLMRMANQESALNPRATSNKGAMGVLQLMPDTAKRFGVTDPYDVDQNIEGGVKYYAWLKNRYQGDRVKATAAYNAGEGNVDKYGGVPPFKETRDYVNKIIGPGAADGNYQPSAPRRKQKGYTIDDVIDETTKNPKLLDGIQIPKPPTEQDGENISLWDGQSSLTEPPLAKYSSFLNDPATADWVAQERARNTAPRTVPNPSLFQQVGGSVLAGGGRAVETVGNAARLLVPGAPINPVADWLTETGKEMQQTGKRGTAEATNPVMKYGVNPVTEGVLASAPAIAGMAFGVPPVAALGGQATAEAVNMPADEGAMHVLKAVTLGKIFGQSAEVLQPFSAGIRTAIASRLLRGGIVGTAAAAMQAADDLITKGGVKGEDLINAGVPIGIIAALTGSAPTLELPTSSALVPRGIPRPGAPPIPSPTTEAPFVEGDFVDLPNTPPVANRGLRLPAAPESRVGTMSEPAPPGVPPAPTTSPTRSSAPALRPSEPETTTATAERPTIQLGDEVNINGRTIRVMDADAMTVRGVDTETNTPRVFRTDQFEQAAGRPVVQAAYNAPPSPTAPTLPVPPVKEAEVNKSADSLNETAPLLKNQPENLTNAPISKAPLSNEPGVSSPYEQQQASIHTRPGAISNQSITGGNLPSQGNVETDAGLRGSGARVQSGAATEGLSSVPESTKLNPTRSDSAGNVRRLGTDNSDRSADDGNEQPKYKYSSTQVDLPHSVATAVKQRAAQIPDSELAEDGREDDPHITVKYGLHGESAEEVRKLLADEPPITAKLGRLSIFPAKEGADYDVVKADVESPDLHRLNKKIADALPHTDTHPTYNPHVTLAYVKPGEGQKYIGDASLEGRELQFDNLTFSSKTGEKVVIPLGGRGAKPASQAIEEEEAELAPLSRKERIEKVAEQAIQQFKQRFPDAEFNEDARKKLHQLVRGDLEYFEDRTGPALLTAANMAYHDAKKAAALPQATFSVGDYVTHPVIGKGQQMPVTKVKNNFVTFTLPDGTEQTLNKDSVNGKRLQKVAAQAENIPSEVAENQNNIPPVVQPNEKTSETQEVIAQDKRTNLPTGKENQATEPSDLVPGTVKLIDRVYESLVNGQKMDNPLLTKWATELFGGSSASGKYSPKDAYDAVEAAVNKYILEHGKLLLEAKPLDAIAKLENLTKLLPTQRADSRTKEQQELQQFSTPPVLSYLAAKALDPKPTDLVLEPSAGTGSLAVWAKAAGATVYVNEISPRRRALLKVIGFEHVTGVDAEFLNSLLPKDIKPTAIIMNPPFSATGGRTANNTKYGAQHVSDALARLVKNGRLVAIVGEGMALDKMTFIPWWKKTAEKYNVRANIGLDGKNYAKYGTTFNNQLLIFDKDGATPGEDWRLQSRNIKVNDYKDVNEAYHAIEAIIQDRPAVQAVPTQATSSQSTASLPSETTASQSPTAPQSRAQVESSPAGASQSDGQRESRQPDSGRRADGNSRSDERSAASTEPRSGESAGTVQASEPEPESGQPGERAGVRSGGGDGADVQSSVKLNERKEETGGKFVEYAPYKLKGGSKHPTKIVESAAMGAVEPPDIKYQPNLPVETKSKNLSNVQLEAVTYAGQRHAQTLPDGKRAGYFIGDGTGVGKGREIAGIILDNYRQGRKRALWVSKAEHLLPSAKRDLEGVGAKIPVYAHHSVAATAALKNQDGVLFTTYNLMSQKAKPDQKSRLDQIKDWLGEDGVIIFDEAHAAQNAFATERGAPSQIGTSVIKIQDDLPQARVVYVSATGATEPRNMAYMTRLGLWGQGTAFPLGFKEFLSQINDGGVGAMEMVSRDLKALGMYVSRSISFDGVDYETMHIPLSDEQKQMYNIAANAWSVILNNISAAIEIIGGGRNARTAAMSQFWSNNQRFFKQLLTAFKVPSVIKRTQKALDDGQQVVISLVGTSEAQTNREITKATQEGADLEDLDLSPREILVNYLVKAFPVHQYMDVPIAGSNPPRMTQVLVRDENGNPVENPEAVALRDDMLAKLADLKFPAGALDQVIQHFEKKGVQVAELTGRKKRLMRNRDTGKMELVKRAPVAADKINEYEMERFQAGRAPVAIISQAAAEGISLHADRGAATAGKRRVQIALELDWSASKQMQTFGRTHRSNQASAPVMILPYTEVSGEKRFVSTMAKRLGSLGAITKGQRDAATADDDLSKYNFFTKEGEAAVGLVYQSLMNNRKFKGLDTDVSDGRQIVKDMGVAKKDKDGKEYIAEEDTTDVSRFLNRVLALDLPRQERVFGLFMHAFDALVRHAKETGSFDDGVEDIKAESIRLVTSEPVYTDPTTGAKTEYKKLETDYKVTPYAWKRVLSSQKHGNGEFYQQKNSKRVIFAEKRSTATDENGSVHQMYAIYQPENEDGLANRLKESELTEKYAQITPEEAQEQWQSRYDAAPRLRTTNAHILSGAILPIWNRLQAASSKHMKIVRVKTDDGERVVGVSLSAANVNRVLRALGLAQQAMKPEQVLAAVMEGGTVDLTDGLKLIPSKLRGEPIIKLTGNQYRHRDVLRKTGLIEELTYGSSTFYVPTDAEKGTEVISKVLQNYPVDTSKATPEMNAQEENPKGWGFAADGPPPEEEKEVEDRNAVGVPDFNSPPLTRATTEEELLDNVQVKYRDGVIYGNAHTTAFLNYLTRDSKNYQRRVRGFNADLESISKVATLVDDWVSENVDSLSDEQTERLRHLTEVLRFAADETGKTSITFVDADHDRALSQILKTKLHESVHGMQREVGQGTSDLVSEEWAKADPDYFQIRRAIKQFAQEMKYSPAKMMTEAVAYILSGDRVRVGYDINAAGREKAAAFIDRYFAEVAHRYGPFALNHFKEYHPDFAEVIQNAKEKTSSSGLAPGSTRDRRGSGETDQSIEGDGQGRTSLQRSLPQGRTRGREASDRANVEGTGRGAIFGAGLPVNFQLDWGTSEVKTAGRKLHDIFKSGLTDLRRTWSPAGLGVSGKQTAGIVREKAAELARHGDIAEKQLQQASKALMKLSEDTRWGFVYLIETGQTQKLPLELQPFAQTIRDLLDERRDAVQALGEGKLQSFYENYFPHIWEEPERAGKVFAEYFGKRPFEGSKSFLKQRTIPTIEHGRALGLKPISDNPVDLVMLKLREMDRYLMAHRVLQEMNQTGLIAKVKATSRAPEGWMKIDDKVSTIYGPRTIPGMVTIRGYLYAPEPAARVLNNYLSPGLRSKAWFRGWVSIGNALNQMQLGWSAFHFGFTSLDAMISKMALAIHQLSRGNVAEALKAASLTTVAPIENVLRGNKLYKAWEQPGSMGPEWEQLAEAMLAGGGRIKMDSFYKSGMIQTMQRAFKEKNVVSTLKGVGLSPLAATEFMSKLLMEYIVPRQKLGVFADLAKAELAHNPNMSREELRATMAKVWDSVDNRMGQLVYDNLFWNKTAKDLTMAAFRSVGWNLGTKREVGGGVMDAAKFVTNVGAKIAGRGGGGGSKPPSMRTASDEWFGGRPAMTYRMEYLAALVIMTGLVGAILNYLFTGERPKEMKDYFFPRTGSKDDEGNAERFSLPSYLKDIYAYYRHPGTTFGHKLHPLLSTVKEVAWDNEDFYGVQIRNPKDTATDQAVDVMKHIGKSFLPFSARNTMEMRDRGDGITAKTVIAPYVGLVPAPKALSRTDAQEMVKELLQKKMGDRTISPEEFDESRRKRELRVALMNGQNISGELNKELASGRFTMREAENVLKSKYESALERGFKSLGLKDALDVWDVSTTEEKQKLKPILAEKVNLLEQIPAAQRPQTIQRFNQAFAK